MSYLISYTVLVPILVAALSIPLSKFMKPKPLSIINAISLLLPGVLSSVALLGGMLPIADTPLIYIDRIGSFAFILDGVNIAVVLGVSVVTAFVAVYSVPYMKHRFHEMEEAGVSKKILDWGIYFFMYTLFSVAMIGVATATNLIWFYIWLELTLIPSFLLIAFYGYGDRAKIAILYLLWTHLGALIFLIGAFLYGLNAGTFDFYQAGINMLSYGESVLSGNMAMLVVALLLLGLFVKLAVFGVHIWLPYAHAEAPTPISALLSPNLIGLAGYAIIRIVYTLFPDTISMMQPFLLGLAILTIAYGGILTFYQSDFKRFLAYSSVSQMGYILLGIASMTPLGFIGALLHYYTHAIGKALLFMSAGVIITEGEGLRDIGKMGGFAAKMPYTSSMAMVGFMHLSGLPPTIGLFSKFFILAGLIGWLSTTSYFIPAIILTFIAVALTPAYSFITMKRIFFGSVKEGITIKEGVSFLIVPMILIAIAGILAFIFPSTLLTPLFHDLQLLAG
jgi:NADH-quinone oxidoreductase subunit M